MNTTGSRLDAPFVTVGQLLSNDYAYIYIYTYSALNITPIFDCYWVGAVPKSTGGETSCASFISSGVLPEERLRDGGASVGTAMELAGIHKASILNPES